MKILRGLWLVVIAGSFMALLASSNWACDYVVQGVINWAATAPPIMSPLRIDTLPRMDKEGWTLPGGKYDLRHYTAWSGYTFIPKPTEIDAKVSFGIFAGGAACKEVHAGIEPTVEFYRIWGWEDVNCNGVADDQDRIQKRPQSWACLYSGAVSVPNVADNISYGALQLQAGKSYLLIIEACSFSQSSMQWESTMLVPWPTLQIEGEKFVQTTWAPDPPAAYGSSWGGIDAFEVIRIRVNNPPARPVVPE